MERIFKEKFNELLPLYSRLASNLSEAITNFLNEKEIPFLTIITRVKNYDSFSEKIKRKGYTNAFEETEDICGIRIICYYKSDIQTIQKIIEKEFTIVRNENKELILNSNQFGYRSHHFIVKVPGNWLVAPNYRGLENLKAEIQVRTVLMHAWAEIQHKLAYKKDQTSGTEQERKFSILSAKLEEADMQFEELRSSSKTYIDSLIANQNIQGNTFQNISKLNLDSLQAFLNYHFPNKKGDRQSTAKLLEDLQEFDITFQELSDVITKTKIFIIQEMEKEEQTELAQVGVVRWALYLTNERYWNSYKNKVIYSHKDWVKNLENWKLRFNNKTY